MSYTVYIVQCADRTLYTGCTNDIEKRVRTHNTSKSGAKYTRARRPVTLVYTEKVSTITIAHGREAEMKRMTRKEKLLLIEKKKGRMK